MKCREVFKSKNVLGIIALSIYIFLGSVIFVHIERPDEPNTVVASRMFNATREKLCREFRANITADEFMALVSQIADALEVQARSEWSYMSTVDWLTISLTTVGYGDVAPRTPIGQGIFVIYAVFGLPLTMITLKNTGEFLSRFIFRFIRMIEKKLLGTDEPVNLKLKTLIVSLLAFIILHVYAAMSFVYFSNTTFLEGVYASFITLSTIGFGDYPIQIGRRDERSLPTPGDGVLQVLYLPYMILNLSIVSCFLNSIMIMMESARVRIRKSNEVTPQDADNDDTL